MLQLGGQLPPLPPPRTPMEKIVFEKDSQSVTSPEKEATMKISGLPINHKTMTTILKVEKNKIYDFMYS